VQVTPESADFYTVEFSWSEDDPGRPAMDVLLRLITPTDFAHDDGDLTPYLMDRGDDGVWRLSLRLPAGLRTSYQFCPVRDEPLRASHPDAERFEKIVAGGVPDPAHGCVIGPSTWPNRGSASVLSLPGALAQPWHTPKGVPAGVVSQHKVAGSSIWIYTPPRHSPTTDTETAPDPYALAVLFDGQVWHDIEISPTFDNLHAAGAIPPTVVVGIEDIQGMPRSEALTRPGVLLPFLLDELLPFVRGFRPITSDPGRTVLGGQSLGGLASVHIGLHAPDRFGLILTQSGSFWRAADSPEEIDSPALLDAYAGGDRLPLRFFQEAGSLERRLLTKNRIFHGILLDRGYPVTYREYEGGHDYACWRGGIADGLIDLLGSPVL
jgi:enterochelin esterase-like enzyme